LWLSSFAEWLAETLWVRACGPGAKDGKLLLELWSPGQRAVLYGMRVAIKGGLAQTQNVTHPAAPVFQPVASPLAAHKSSGAKILFIVLSVLILFGAVGVGGIVFVGYRAKQKIAELKKEYGLEVFTRHRCESVGSKGPNSNRRRLSSHKRMRAVHFGRTSPI
jgi:hypothetical protein